MNKEKHEEVIAKLALIEYERKAKLREIIDESAWHYYFGNARFVIAILLFSICFFSALYLDKKIRVYWLMFIIANVIFGEIARINRRFNALAKLYEIEKNENEVTPLDQNSAPASAKATADRPRKSDK